MSRIQRNWKMIVCVFVILVLPAGVLMRVGGDATATAQSDTPGGDTHTPVTDVERDRVLRLLAEIDLTPGALTALNASEDQAIDIVAGARTWLDENLAQIDALTAAIGAARVEVRRLERLIRLSTGDDQTESELETARQNLADARQAYDAALASARNAVAEHLTAGQNATWTHIQHGWGQSFPLAMLDLTNQQRLDLGRAKRHTRLRLAEATNAEERAAADAAWQTAQEQILTAGQLQTIDNYHSYAANAADTVNLAVDTALPVTADVG